MSIRHLSRWLSLPALVLAAGLGTSGLGAAEVARWTFDATPQFEDVTVGTSDLTAQGGAAITTAIAPARRQGTGALALNGTTHYATTADALALDVKTTGLTISAWVYANSFGGNPRIIEKGSDSEYRLIFTGTDVQFEIFGVGSVSSVALPSTGAWHHVVGVWDPSATPTDTGSVFNGVMYLYVDGVQVAANDTLPGAAGALPADDTGALAIGGKNGGSDFFDGTIDDVRLFDGPLDLAGIKALAPAATAMVFTTQPATSAAGASLTPVVHTVDDNGYDSDVGLTPGNVTMTIGNNPGTSTLGGTTAVALTSSVATFTNLTLNKVGTAYTLSAAFTGLTSVASSAFNITPGTATKVAFAAQPTTAQAGAELTPDVTVSVLDANDNVVTGSSVNVTVAIDNNPGTSTLGGTTTVAAASGVATFGNLTLNKVGTAYTLSASSGALTVDNSAAFNITPGAATKVAFGAQPTTAQAGAELTPDVTVSVLDANDNVVTGSSVNVTVAIGNNPGTSTLGGTTTVAAASGVATFGNLTLNKVGTAYTLSASSGALTVDTSAAFNITPSTATKLGFLQNPTTTVAGAEVTPDVTVQVLDAYDNVVTGSTATIDVAIGTNPGTSTLGGDASEAAAAGVATFDDLTLNKVGTGYTLTAASTGLTGATSSAFNITPSTATKLAFLQQPTTTVAGAEVTPDVTVQVLDAFDNVVTGSTVTIDVAIGTNPGTSTLGGDASEAAVAGVATFDDLTLNKVGTSYTLTAASTGLTGATSTVFDITIAAAAKLAFLQQPTTTVAGAEVTPDVTVQVLDAFDNVVTGSTATIDLAIGTNPGTSTLSGDASEAAIAGVATFGDLTLNKVGTGYTLTAASTGLTGATSGAFNITPGTATQVAFTQEPTSAAAGSAIAPAVTASVLDANDNVVTSSTVTIDVAIGTNSGTSTLGGTASVAAVAGVATFNDLTLNKVGTGYTLTAASTGLTSDTSAVFDITPGAATQVAFTQEPTSAAAGAAIAPAVTVSVLDANDNVVTSSTATIDVAIGTNSGLSTLGGTASVAAVAGVATFSDLTLNKVGTGYTLTAASTGLTGDTSATFGITPGAATQVAFAQDPSSAVAGVAIAPAVSVSVLDANDNVVTSSTATIDVAIGTNPGVSTLGGTASVAAVAGVATFSDLTLNKVGTGYTLTAASTGLTGDTSATFAITVAAGSQLVFATQPVDSVAGAVIPLVLEIQDAFGNPTAATDAITIAIGTNPGGGTLAGTVTVSAAAGSATFTDLSINRTGSAYTLVASVAGFTDLISSTFSITPDVAHGLAFTVDPTDAVAGATQAGNVEVEIIDQHGNRATAATDTVVLAFGANPSSATLGGTTSLAAVAGLAVFPGLTVSAAGNDYTLVASSGVLATATSATFDVSAAGGGGSGGGGGSSSGGCGLGSAAPFAALMLMMLMMARLRSGRRSDHHV